MTETTSLSSIITHRIGHQNIDVFFNLMPDPKQPSAIVPIFISNEIDF